MCKNFIPNFFNGYFNFKKPAAPADSNNKFLVEYFPVKFNPSTSNSGIPPRKERLYFECLQAQNCLCIVVNLSYNHFWICNFGKYLSF